MELNKEFDLSSLINKPNTEFNIPLNSLRTPAPTNAPAQNASLGSKFLNSIGAGAQQGLGKILSSGSNLASIGSLLTSGEGLSGNQKKMSIADSSVNTIGDIASNFGPQGALIGAGLKAINTIGGKFVKTPKEFKEYSVNQNISGSYGGVLSGAQDAQSDVDAYKKSGLIGKLIGRSSIKDKVKEANARQYSASKITDEQNMIKDAATNSMDLLSQQTTNKLRRDNPNILLSKNGGKLPKFRYGGSIIVSGSLHARKHDIDKDSKILKDIKITDKGVPVIAINKDGGEMVAEFEKEELVLRKDLIDRIKEMEEEYEDKDKLYIEVGKLISKEILSHTKDKDGLIDNIE